ncbi:MAG: transposase [Desulfocapsaceae bacterium]|nr:transposase [Desulfocapsaceae bacterium]
MLPTQLTAQEERLVSILEIVQVERHVPKSVTRFRYPGRKPLDRQAMARAFMAKALYLHPTTRDLHRALHSAGNLRRICGFAALGDIPSESTFSRAFAEFAAGSFGNRVLDTLLKQYVAEELVGHINRDSTAIASREKPAKKVAKEVRKPRKRGLAKGEQREPAIEKRLD